MLNRRNILKASVASPLLAALPLSGLEGVCNAAKKGKRPKVAAIYTSFTYRSHAHVILENFLEPYLFNGVATDPGVDVVSIYRDQKPQGDMTDAVAAKYKIPVYDSIAEALCVGGDELAVDAVLSIGEHGSYPQNELGQVMYPRKRFFDEIVAVMKKSNRFVPMFNDKHLSYRFDWAKEMYDTAKDLGIPYLAGSSVPLAQRRPAIEIKPGTRMAEAVAVHGGPVESYDFHGLELLQSMVEFRKGGESGIKRITFYEGEQVFESAKAGIWDIELGKAAIKAELGYVPENWGHLEKENEPEVGLHAIVIDYLDGFKGTVLRIGRDDTRWNFAYKVREDSEPIATEFYVGPWNNRNLFKALSHAIQQTFITGKPVYPVERTLLVTGALDVMMHARKAPGHPYHAKQLEIPYKPVDFRDMREYGKSWDIITEEIPQPNAFDNGLPAHMQIKR